MSRVFRTFVFVVLLRKVVGFWLFCSGPGGGRACAISKVGGGWFFATPAGVTRAARPLANRRGPTTKGSPRWHPLSGFPLSVSDACSLCGRRRDDTLRSTRYGGNSRLLQRPLPLPGHLRRNCWRNYCAARHRSCSQQPPSRTQEHSGQEAENRRCSPPTQKWAIG